MLPKVGFMSPFLQFIKALAVAKNGHPRMIGILEFAYTTNCVSKVRKSTGQ